MLNLYVRTCLTSCAPCNGNPKWPQNPIRCSRSLRGGVSDPEALSQLLLACALLLGSGMVEYSTARSLKAEVAGLRSHVFTEPPVSGLGPIGQQDGQVQVSGTNNELWSDTSFAPTCLCH